MKKILALILVLSLFGSLVACTEVTRISVEEPAKMMLEKSGGTVAITLSDEKTVDRITGLVEQIPLQMAEESGDDWTYRLTWLDAEGKTITAITLAGTKIRWEGTTYSVSIGVDLSVLTDALETIPGLNQE